jgi:hypothetical protein
MALRHRLLRKTKAKTGDTMDKSKKVLKMERKRRRTGSKRIGEISLLEFTRQVVDMIVKKHIDFNVLPSRRTPPCSSLLLWLSSGLKAAVTLSG